MLSWKLWPQQVDIYQTIRALPRTVQTVVCLLARQYGKSVLGTILATEDCLQNPNVVVMIIGPTIKQTRAIVRPRMKLICQDSPTGLIKEVKSDDTWYFANGSELKLGGFDLAGCSSQRGKTLHKVYLEETCDSNSDDYDNFLRSDLGPALTHSKHAQIIHLTTLPRVPDHKFTLETIPDAKLNGAYFERTIHDNKALTPEKYAQCVKLCGGEHTVEFQREYLCKQVRDSAIILVPEFDEPVHVAALTRPEHSNYWLAGDVGGVRDKSVFLLCTYDFKTAKIYILDECAFPSSTSTDDQLKAVKAMCHGYDVRARWVDAPGQLQVDLMKVGFPCALPNKVGYSLDATVNSVRMAINANEVLIDPKCKLTITTLRSGTFNNTKTDLARTASLGHMDAFMALAYGIRMANKSNPYPAFGGAHPSDPNVYVPREDPNKTHNAYALTRAFNINR